jgi:DNA-binding NtrC family response regulator
MAKTKILVIEDDPDGRRSVCDAVNDLGFQAVPSSGGLEGLQIFEGGAFVAVITDLVMPDIDGMEVLSRIHDVDDTVPVLMITAYGTVSSAVEAIKSGAYDYITKPLNLDDFQAKIERAAETGRLREEVKQLQQGVHSQYGIDGIVAESPAMRAVMEQVKTVAGTTATVLIQGESGTGKEVVARALHAEGTRKHKPYVAVNCGGFTESLLESELFGHEKGAFTGAIERRKGAFEQADGGTLFLDEVGTAPASVQVKLLRVLEEREFMRVGGQASLDVDVRVVSASNQDLEELVKDGNFREDLLYRLKVVTIGLPPLRERREDIRPLVDVFVTTTAKTHGRNIVSVDPELYAELEKHQWPGNVRQLRNVIESSVVMSRGPALGTEGLQISNSTSSAEGDFIVPEGKTFAELEEDILSQLLRRHDGNRTLVADKLGISRRTIQRKIKDYGLPY